MSNEWKVATLDQCKILDKVLVGFNTENYWIYYSQRDKWFVGCIDDIGYNNAGNLEPTIPAPDVAEIGVLLPSELGDDWSICIEKDDQHFIISYDGAGEVLGNKVFCEESEAQARAAAVIYLIEKKRATWDQEKQMLIAV